MAITVVEKMANAYVLHLNWVEDPDEQSIEDILAELKPMMQHDLNEELRARKEEANP